MPEKNMTRVNNQIKCHEVRLIDQNGHNVGVVSIKNALYKSREANLDLVEISPNAEPPVCKIMDFGKFKYEKQKKTKENTKASKVLDEKEIRLRPATGKHDLEIL
jgi:translation initiation factor IF-3